MRPPFFMGHPLLNIDVAIEERTKKNKSFGTTDPRTERTSGRFVFATRDQRGTVEIRKKKTKEHEQTLKLPLGSLGQVGWATIGFIVDTSNGIGIGDDGYSWCFDGSRGTSYNNGDFQFLLANVRWKKNNVCGCGIIEINGEITRIKYWLNSKFLGTSFAH
ncbi:unnamed protein product [Rotaria magnacalcarata]|uniref:Uncharacterized protein n=1 Tax=Rotaria magnacalcarata TaxID=392030 RepID=A0A820NUE6_9BILA|nr:unnamed protein product [Rotaria magnacalcarata]